MHVHHGRSRPARRRRAGRAGTDPAARARRSTARSCSIGRGSSSARRPTPSSPRIWQRLGWDGPIMSAVTGRACPSVVGTAGVARPRGASGGRRPEGVVVLRPEAERRHRRARRRRRVPAARPRRRAGRRAQRRHDARGARPTSTSGSNGSACRKMLAKAGAQEGDVDLDRRVQLRLPAGPLRPVEP